MLDSFDFSKSEAKSEVKSYTNSSVLMTDMYEYTMLDAALKDGTADRKCVFCLLYTSPSPRDS